MFLKSLILILLTFQITTVCLAKKTGGYYFSVTGLIGQNLKAALHKIIKGHTEIPYSICSTDTWNVLKQTDKHTLNPDNLILIYTG